MRKLYTIILTLLLICGSTVSRGQGNSEMPTQTPSNRYQSLAESIRAEVWGWDIPAFSNYSVPDIYAGESGVILARHRQIDATARRGSYWTNPVGKLFYTDIDRYMVKINDQAALDKFSAYSFKEEKKYGFIDASTESVIIGARVIKPDGTIIEVDVSQNAVSVTEGKKDKEAYKKLSIPQLQKGDILDMFICEIYDLIGYNLPIQSINFYSVDYPAQNFSYEIAFGKNLTIEYRSLNGAPRLTRDSDANKNIVLRASAEKVMRINDTENTRWVSWLRDLSMIRFNVLQNGSKYPLKPESARPFGVHENVGYEQIVEDAKCYLASYKRQLISYRDIKKRASEVVDNYKRNNPGINSDELADLIFTALNFEWKYSDYRNYDELFALLLDQLFKNYGIDSRIGFTTNRYGSRKEDILSTTDLQVIVAANNCSKLYYIPYRYRVPGDTPPVFQGESATIFTLNNMSGSSVIFLSIDASNQEMITIPESKADDNINITHLEASLLPEDSGKLLVKRNSTWSGALKDEIQPWLISYENWDTTMRRYLNIDKSLVDDLNQKRDTRKNVAQLEESLEKQRREYDQTIKHEIFAYHYTEPVKVENYKFSSFGVTKTQPNLIYDLTYTMDGFVRKAGENLIMDIGKLIGMQWNPTDNERARSVDSYMPTPRIFQNEITFKIPDGYTIGDIDHLNISYSNEYISFQSNASIDGETITIKTKKTYHKAFIPKENWNSLMEGIDKTNDFYSSSIVLQKR